MSQRNPKPYEICLSDKSLTGVHQWHLEQRLQFNRNTGMDKTDGKKAEVVCCKICKAQPPNNMRGRIGDGIRDQIARDKEQKRMAKMFRVSRRR